MESEISNGVQWKRMLIRSAGFGAGFAIATVVLLGGLYLWSIHPKAWTTDTITAGKPTLNMEGAEPITFHVRFPVTNHTGHEYLVPGPPSGSFLTKRAEDGTLLKVDDATWDEGLRIPPGQTVNVTFTWKVKESDYNTTYAELTAIKPADGSISPGLDKFITTRMDEWAGFVFFDYLDNVKIDMPRDWHLPDSKF